MRRCVRECVCVHQAAVDFPSRVRVSVCLCVPQSARWSRGVCSGVRVPGWETAEHQHRTPAATAQPGRAHQAEPEWDRCNLNWGLLSPVTARQRWSQPIERLGPGEPGGHTWARVPTRYAAQGVVCVAMLPGELGDTAAVT